MTDAFSYKNTLYYLTEDEEKQQIIKLDMNSFKEEAVFAKIINRRINSFLNFGGKEEFDYINNHGEKIASFFVAEENIFYLTYNNRLYAYNMKSKKTETLFDFEISDYSSDGQFIYYIDSKKDIYKYSIKGKNSVKISENKSDFIYLTHKGLLYRNLSDKLSLYLIDKDTRERKISKFYTDDICTDENYIYYTCAGSDKKQGLFRMDFNGKKVKKIADKYMTAISCFKNSDRIFFLSTNKKTGDVTYNSIKKDGTDLQKIK